MVVTSKYYMRNNPISNTDTVIIVPTYNGHLMFLKYVLQKYKETGKYVLCSFDRRPDSPPEDILSIPNAWIYIHKIYGAEKRLTWLWHTIYSSGMILRHNNIKFVITSNGDCVWDKPENIDNLFDLIGDNDIMSASSESNLIHTCNAVWKRECFLDFTEHIRSKLENNIPKGYSPEVLLRDFIKNSNYKNKIVDKQPLYPTGHRYEGQVDHYSSYCQNGTFNEIVGYRNLGGELKSICQEHLTPLDKKYMDLRDNGKYFDKHQQDTLVKYYLTGDYRFLYQYFDTGEDSFYNRRYFPLEYYGTEPLKDDSKRKELGPYSEREGWFDRFKYFSYIIKDKEYEEKWKEFIKERGYDK